MSDCDCAEPVTVEELLWEFMEEGCIECRGCGSRIEIDCDVCGECGWHNPAIGFI